MCTMIHGWEDTESESAGFSVLIAYSALEFRSVDSLGWFAGPTISGRLMLCGGGAVS